MIATWTFRTFKRFDTSTFRYLSGRFASCLKVCKLRYCKNFFVVRWRNVQGGSETSWYLNVQRWETSRWRTGKVAKRPVTISLPAPVTTSGWVLFWQRHACVRSCVCPSLKTARFTSCKDQNVPIPGRVCMSCLALQIFSALPLVVAQMMMMMTLGLFVS